MKKSKGVNNYNNKDVEDESQDNSKCFLCTGNNPEEPREGTEIIENQSENRKNPDYTIIKIGQNTEKSRWYLL